MKLAFEIPKKRERVEDPSKDKTTVGSSLSASATFLVYLNSKGCSDPTESPHITNLSLKDKTQKAKQCRLVYSVKCKEYIGETGRTLGVRFKEHTDGKHPSSAITEHTSTRPQVQSHC